MSTVTSQRNVRSSEPSTHSAFDHATLEVAADLGRHGVRALDAIHLSTARSLGEDLDCFVAYDERLVAARASGLRIEQPR